MFLILHSPSNIGFYLMINARLGLPRSWVNQCCVAALVVGGGAGGWAGGQRGTTTRSSPVVRCGERAVSVSRIRVGGRTEDCGVVSGGRVVMEDGLSETIRSICSKGGTRGRR
jgi:hypothetical protein